ncbi:MAG: sulfite exporter TauE/SafE family protein [Myxococcota bacterium]|nr:sulfite exporter TauE/SafE family protein [Myxococcota bacterium]
MGAGLLPGSARAHPELVALQTHRATRLLLAEEGITLEQRLILGEIPGLQARRHLDADADTHLSAAELAVPQPELLASLAGCLELAIDERVIPLSLAPEPPLLDGGMRVIAAPVVFPFFARIPLTTGEHTVRFVDRCALRGEGLVELAAEPVGRCQVESFAAPGGQLSGTTAALFPGAMPREGRQITLRIRTRRDGPARDAPPGEAIAADPTAARLRDALGRDLGLAMLLGTLLAAFLLGAGHALAPGHGKALVAAYLVGRRGTARDALLLGLSVTATHVASVLLLGLLTLFASRYLLPEQILPWIGLGAGLLVVGLGLRLLLGATRGHGHEHEHEHEHGHEHGHAARPATAAPRWGETVLLGISGGLVPCPTALVVLLSAIALNRIVLGLGLILVFSLGLASVLVLLGLLVVRAGRLTASLPASWLARVPRLSGLIVLLLGLTLVLKALDETGLLRG